MRGVEGGAGRRHGGVALVAAAVMVAGCTDGSGGGGGTPSSSTSSTTATIPAASPSVSASPSPTSNARAQAATEAKSAYTTYNRTVNRVYRDGGTNGQAEFAKVAAGERLTFLVKQARALQRDKAHQTGSSVIRQVGVGSVALGSGAKLSQVTLDACLDYSSRDFVNADGKSLVPTKKNELYGAFVILTEFGDDWLVTSEKNGPVRSC